MLEAATEKKLTGEEITLPQTVAWASRLHASSRYEEVGGKKDGKKNGKKSGKGGKGGDQSSADDDDDADDADRALGYWMMGGVVYSAIVMSGCLHLRHWLPWLQNIVFMQSIPFLCYWPECIFSFLVAFTIFFFHYLLLMYQNETMIPSTKATNNNTTTNTTTKAATTNATTKTKAKLLLGTHSVTFLKVSDIDELLSSQGFMDGIMNDKEIFVNMSMETTPIVGVSPVPREKDIVKAANPTCRARGETWDASLGINEYAVILQYVRKFLAKTHRDIGRSGPVCPFVPKSLRKDALHFSVIRE